MPTTSTADIVVIGGGVHGASLAFHLAGMKAGKVVLLEKRFLSSGPTAKSGAMIRPLFTEPAYIQLVLEATWMFEQWDEVVGGDAGFVQHGFLRITDSLDRLALGADLDLVRKLGASFEILSVDDLPRYVPDGEFTGGELGIFLPKGGFADPILTTVQMAQAAERRGVEIIEGVEVTGIQSENGRIAGVQTGAGRISTRLLVNCSGAWGDRIAAMLGIRLPLEVHRTPTCLFRRPERMPPGGPILSDGVNRVYIRALGDTLLRAAPFGWSRDVVDPDSYDETVPPVLLDEMRSALHQRLKEMRRATSFGGFSAVYDMTPDGHPIVCNFPEEEGFWCNCGWSGNGFASAPALGRCLAQMILTGSSDIDISIFQWPRPAQVQERPDMQWIFR